MVNSAELDILSTIYREVHPVDDGGYALIDNRLYGYANPSLDIVEEPVYYKAIYRKYYIILFEDNGRSVKKLIFLNKNGTDVKIHEFSGKHEGDIVVSGVEETQALGYKLLILKIQNREIGNTRIGAVGPTGEMIFNAVTGELLKYSPGGKYISSSYRPFNNKIVYTIEEVGEDVEVENTSKKKSNKNSVFTGVTEDLEMGIVPNILNKYYNKVEDKKGPFARYLCTAEDGSQVFLNKFGQIY